MLLMRRVRTPPTSPQAGNAAAHHLGATPTLRVLEPEPDEPHIVAARWEGLGGRCLACLGQRLAVNGQPFALDA